MRTADGRSHTIRNVIWDVDGTLFATYPAIARAFGAALADLGAEARIDRIEALARVSLGHCATTLAVEQHLDPAALDEAFGRHYERRPRGAEPVFPGARDVCARIRQGGGQNVIVTHRGR